MVALTSSDSAERTVAGVRISGASGLRALVQRRHTPVPVVSGRPADMQERAMLYTRGSTLRSTMEFLGRALGADRIEAVLARLAPVERATVETTTVTADVPYETALKLWRSADLEMRELDPQWAEHAGAEAIRVLGMQLYSGLLQKPGPIEFLTQHISLFQRYYRPGDMKVTSYGPGRATARLIGFEPGDTLFCRRQSGGWKSVIEIAGGRETTVDHARCSLEGDMFCEWVIRWK